MVKIANKKTIRTRNKVRTIYVPTALCRGASSIALKWLNKAQRDLCPDAHAFVPGRSVVTQAREHVGREYSVSVDLANWFDSITAEQAHEAVSAAGKHVESYLWRITHEGRPRQGLPCSPAIANLAGRHLDMLVREAVERLDLRRTEYSYTRYADDLTVSYGRADLHDVMVRTLTQCVEALGWQINDKKTHRQWSGAGRRVICGVAIDDEGNLHATRKLRRKLRAAMHRDPNSHSARGLTEWARMRPPADDTEHRRVARVVCQGHLHRIIDYGGKVIAANHDAEEIEAGIVAACMGLPTTRCAEVVAVMRGIRHPGGVSLPRKWTKR